MQAVQQETRIPAGVSMARFQLISKPAFSEATTGRIGLVTISTPYENAAAAEEGYDWVRAGATSVRARRMADITEDSARVPFSILHSDVQL